MANRGRLKPTLFNKRGKVMDIANILSKITMIAPILVIVIALVLMVFGRAGCLVNIIRAVMLFVILGAFALFLIAIFADN